MSTETERRLLEALYDRIWETITFTPPGRAQIFNKQTTFVQLSRGEALNPNDFKNQLTPNNPNGDLNTTELFSTMVDAIPAVQADYTPTARRVSEVYRQIVNGANSSATVDPQQQRIYNMADDFLNDEVEQTDFMGNTTKVRQPSHIAQVYDDNQLAYVSTIGAYRTAYFNYDLTNPQQQRQWQANAPMLELAMTQAYNKWRREGATQVEQAQNAMATTINSLVRAVITEAQRQMAEQNSFASSLGGASRWYLAYPLPTNWADPANNSFTEFNLSSTRRTETTNERFRSYGGGASWNAGLISVGGGVSGSSSSTHYHLESDDISISGKLLTVRIQRSWLNDLIFRMNNWFTDAFDRNKISNGTLRGNENAALPLIPVGFVVARDLTISGNFSTVDRQRITSSISGGGGVRIGPFSLGGRYSYSRSNTTFKAETAAGGFKAPGLHIVAWISEIVPPSPPQ